MANQDDLPLYLASERARAYLSVSGALEVELMTGASARDEANTRFDAMRNVAACAIRLAARDWNDAHDRMRVLPLELRALCWSFLPPPDIIRLASVCSSWRDTSRAIPSLWAALEVSGSYRVLDTLFLRSGQRSVDLSVSVATLQDLVYVDECVGRQAHRLRALHVFQEEDSYILGTERVVFFHYPVPILKTLTLDIKGGNRDIVLRSHLFKGQAPKLLSVTLRDVLLPPSCPAFGCVTDLALRWRRGSREATGVEHVFNLAPRIQRLEIYNMAGLQGLPVIPASSRLGQASLFCERLSLDTLQSHGYLRLPRLLVSTQYNIEIIVTAMLHHAPGLETTLAVCATGCVRVDLRHGESGATAAFSTRSCHADFFRSGIFGHASLLQHLSRLELPAGLSSEPDGSLHYPYIRGEMHLPALRTLVIAHSIQGVASLLDPGP
ncbi:hypothetical protein AURDEDRAFT_161709 [Auricularia subglabra TFB-10046 SS5]|nr:hypothetical protein AURDEDRAFT_161709 [Auricularia subglabra TFB-10046 SS5]